jgi:hypothetical protein
MNIKVAVLYGNNLPPYEDIERILDKYISDYLQAKRKESYREENFCEIWLEYRITNPHRYFHPGYTQCIPVAKDSLTEFTATLENVPGHFALCLHQHGHPQVVIHNTLYEGYYLKTVDHKGLFFLCTETDLETNKIKHWTEMEWFHSIPAECRWLLFDHNKASWDEVEKRFEAWIQQLHTTYAG